MKEKEERRGPEEMLVLIIQRALSDHTIILILMSLSKNTKVSRVSRIYNLDISKNYKNLMFYM